MSRAEFASVPEVSHAARHHGYFWLLVRRDLRIRYAGSTLGALWNLIHPILMIFIYMTIFSSVMRSRMGDGWGTPVNYGELTYGVHLCAGLIPWMMFSEVLNRSIGVLLDNSNFLKKVSFPPLVLFTSLYFNAALIYTIAYLAFYLILLVTPLPSPTPALAGLPVMWLMGAAGLGLGLLLSGLNVFFRDTAQFVSIAMQLLFWFNPIVYFREIIYDPTKPVAELDSLERVGRFLLLINPFERYIHSVQWLFGVTAHPPTALDWTIVVAFPVMILLLGGLLFRRMLSDVRDCL